MNPLWRVERAVVDQARTVVGRVQPLPRLPEGWTGPLLGQPAQDVLAFVDDHPMHQPDRTSCGSATLTMLRMLREPAYAASVREAVDPEHAFGVAALGVRLRTNAAHDPAGHLQLPWPAALGTRPAAMIRLLHGAHGYADPRLRFHNVVVDPADPGRAFDAAVRTVRAGEPVPLYIGDGRWMQHIVLVVRAAPDSVEVYDPAYGGLVPVSREEWEHDRLGVAGWQRPWLVILPGSRR